MKRGGFTLIDLMIVVACLGLGVTGGWAALSTLRRAGAADGQLMHATTALESEMDRLRAACETGRRPRSGSFVDPELPAGATGQRNITAVGPRLLRAVITVRWRTPTNQARQTTLVSLLARGPVR